MNPQEILAKIAKLKNAIESESDPDVKSSYQKVITKLEIQIAEAEKKVEQKEEKAAAEEKKELSEAEQRIAKLKAAIASESDPEVKEKYQKKIDSLQGTLKEVKEEIKEEKKEIAEQKKEIKQAVQEVKSAVKEVRKTAIKKAAVKVTERKKTEVKKTKRKTKLKSIISELDSLIAKNKKLKSKYTSQYKGAGKTTDLKRDAARSAKPFGYRFVGKHDYRVPTEQQIRKGLKRGTIDYEARPNRSDVFPKKTVKLADGGMMAKGGKTLKYGQLHGNDGQIDTIFEPIIGYKLIEKGTDGETFTVEILKYPNYGGKGVRYYYDDSRRSVRQYSSDFNKLKELMDETLEYHNEKITKIKYADGGMMAKGGEIKVGDIITTKTGVKVKVVAYDPKFGGRVKVERQDEYATGKPSQYMPLSRIKMADGGMMADDGEWKQMEIEEYKRKINGPVDVYLKKAGKTKEEPKVIRGYSDDESYEYAKGGKTKDVTTIDILNYPSKKRALNTEINNEVLNKIDRYLTFVPNTKQEYTVKLKGASRGEYGVNKEQGDKIIEIINASGKMADGGMMAYPKYLPVGVSQRELNKKIKDWYIKNYPTDDLGQEINDRITFKSFWAYSGQGYTPYEALGVADSVVRERVEEKLSAIFGMMAKGGAVKKKVVGFSKEDKARYAKPAGWRWKEEALTKRIIERKQLSMSPSKKMRDKYPDLVYYEDRLNKADKNPRRTSADSI